jgi:predicted  nucleic acid-binding Zn-ribbon protein
MDKLLGLQELDIRAAHLKARRAVLESGDEVAATQAKADEAQRVVGELGLRLDEVEREQKRMEFEVDSMTQKSDAEEKRMYDGSVSNSKELESMQAEVKNLKDRRGRVEDDLLEVLVGREELEGEISTARGVLESAREQFSSVEVESARELGEIVATLGGLESDRAAVAAQIDEELLELYDDLRASKKGVGAAALVDGVCMGCHEKLSALELDKLKKTEDIKRCDYCRRILIDA